MARTSQRYQIEIPKREEGNLFLTPPHRESSNSPKRALVAGAARSFAFLFRASKKRRWMGLVMEIDMKLDGVFFHPSMGVLHFRLLAYGVCLSRIYAQSKTTKKNLNPNQPGPSPFSLEANERNRSVLGTTIGAREWGGVGSGKEGPAAKYE
ncbi:uncharacterized protein H6S33_000604 [Morchella sextelata]|uniref:uncharacterized protein n=1 Tax=Morchella sextelata TaxID=1174677 RepID=UPI001D03AA12|nr:uncharacterized protein H6S33_000604 [Morchella sextelata]KAH0614968.1 hypothetical protein H6S33_000604 [Morchella sextelata]